MDRERQQRLGQILAQVEPLDGPERDRIVRQACAGDPDLEAEARSLLAALGSAGGFLHSPTVRAPTASPGQSHDGPGAVVGRYKLLQEIGEGGFGIVYLAEQREPVERRVAVKIIKLGMDSKQVVARFEAERQALAMMDHPNIARVFDGGTTEAGRPYFVMELVRGDPITRHCITNRLSTTERLELFEQVCRAVQHAHTKGIIHRDLKPGNVLVTMVDGRPVPKIIDFGIARATNGRLTDKTYFTEHRQLIGTPEYMSPEQADNSGVDVDARTDIYSLGVLLYELLTGVTPLDPQTLRTAAWDELLRIIREQEPPRPSARLSMASGVARRDAPPDRPPAPDAGQVRGDLDWIVMRCLEKERARRYETAEALAADVRRHLLGEPVLAAPPSSAYRVRVFARRHRGPLIAASLLLVAIVAGAAATAVFAVLESRARARAEAAEATSSRRADDLQRVVEFQRAELRTINPAQMGAQIREDLLAQTRAALARADAVTADDRMAALRESLAGTNFTSIALSTLDRSLFGRSLKAIQDEFADQPLVRATLLDAAATTMSVLGLFDSALPPMQEALAIRRRLLGGDHADTIASLIGVGELLRATGRLPEAEQSLREAMDVSSRVRGPDHTATLAAMSGLASTLTEEHKFAEADPLVREALDRSSAALGEDHPRTLGCITAQAIGLFRRGELTEAEQLCRGAVDRCRRVLGPDHPDTLELVNTLGSTLWAEHRPAEAEPYISEALTTARRLRGDDHPRTLAYLFNSGALLRDLGNQEEAEQRFREACERGMRVQGRDHPQTAVFFVNLAELQLNRHETPEAVESFRTASNAFLKLYGEKDAKTVRARRGLGRALSDAGRFPEAEAQLLGAEAGSRGDVGASRLSIEMLVAFYERWDEADPGKGHAAAAAEWSARRQPVDAAAGLNR